MWHTILAFVQASIATQMDGIMPSVAIIFATVAIAVSKGYLNKQFSGVYTRINGVESQVAKMRVEMAEMDGRIKSIPADTSLQIAESYEKGSGAARAAFVAKESCGQRQKDVDRRLDGIDSVAREAAHHAEQANYRIENLENSR